MAKNKTLTEQDILNALPNQPIEALLKIASTTAELIQKEEKEAEEKLELIRKGGDRQWTI